MFSTDEELVFGAKLKVAEAAHFTLAIWIEIEEFFAELDAEVRCNSFCDVYCDARLAVLWSIDRGNSRKRQFIVHERIIGGESCWKETRARKPMATSAVADREQSNQNYQNRYTIGKFHFALT